MLAVSTKKEGNQFRKDFFVPTKRQVNEPMFIVKNAFWFICLTYTACLLSLFPIREP